MNSLRQCEIVDHFNNPSTCLCVSLHCQEQTRFLCQTCLLKRQHNHNQERQLDYIIELNNSQQIERILRERLQQIQVLTFRKMKKYAQTMQQAIKYISELMMDAQQKYENHLKNTIRLFQKVVNQSPFDIQNILRLSKEDLQKLFKINPSFIDLNLMDDQLLIIEQAIENFNQQQKQNQHIVTQPLINMPQINIPQNIPIFGDGYAKNTPIIIPNDSQRTNVQFPEENIDVLINTLIDSEYSQKIVHSSKNNLYHAEISPNERYLVYGGKDQILYIYDLNKLEFQNYKLDNYISVCRFTENSEILYVGCNQGYVYGFEIDGNFKQIFQTKILKDWIVNIYLISLEEMIISSEDSYVARLHITKGQQPLIAYCKGQGSLFGLEYDKTRDVIIVAGEGKSIIALFGQTGVPIMNKPQAHANNICQMSLINNQILITMDLDGRLKWWKINYIRKRFEEFRSYYDSENKIYGFYISLANKFIIYFGEKSINVIDQDNQTIFKQIEFSAKGLCNNILYISQIQINSSIEFFKVYISSL